MIPTVFEDDEDDNNKLDSIKAEIEFYQSTIRHAYKAIEAAQERCSHGVLTRKHFVFEALEGDQYFYTEYCSDCGKSWRVDTDKERNPL